jgi:hypothetical protein
MASNDDRQSNIIIKLTDTITSFLLGLVQSYIGLFNQQSHAGAMLGFNRCDTDTYRHKRFYW